MKWAPAALIAVVAAVGCQSSQPTVNPFLGPTTVPPPPTGRLGPSPPGQPYYQSAPPPAGPATITPVPSTVPPGGAYGYPQSAAPVNPAAAPSVAAATPWQVTSPESAPSAPATHDIADRANTLAPTGEIRVASDDRPLIERSAGLPAIESGSPATVQVAIVPPSPPAAVYAAPRPTNQPTLAPPQTTVVAREITDLPPADRRPEVAQATYASSTTAASTAVVQTGFTARQSSSSTEPISSYGHAADYGTLRGKLEFSLADRQWKLRYIPVDGETDDYGGSVVISNPDVLGSYKAGDIVSVQGHVIDRGNDAETFAPSYQVAHIESVSG